MKKLLFLLLIFFATNIFAQLGEHVTRTCIVCGQEWTDEESPTTLSSWGTITGTNLIYWRDYREPSGTKWSVSLHDNAYLCDHCYSLYGGGWQEILKDKFNQLLKQAIEEQQNYSAKVKTQIKIKRLKELEEKLDNLKKEIDEVKK